MAPHYVGSQISDIAVPKTNNPAFKYIFYISGRNGGVWKTQNNGVTFKPIFDHYGTTSIGAIGLAPSDPNIIWVGTGEATNRRSSHAGNGIYKSINGGENFQYMGLKDSQHIARVVVDPDNKNVIYVAAVGHLFSTNKMRGVFKTINGGKTWKKVLYVNNHTGVIDLVIDPQKPNILYAVTYDRQRYPWGFKAGGPGSGIYKSMDDGDHWKRLKAGLPDGKIGRIGIDIYPKNPDILYAVIDNLNPQEGSSHEVRGGEVYRTGDAGTSWVKMNKASVDLSSKEAYTFNQIMIDPNDERHLFVNNVSVQISADQGKTWQNVGIDPAPTPSLLDSSRLKHTPLPLFNNMFGDIETMWIDPHDSRHLMIGTDGGLFATFDGGQNMQHFYHIPLGEVYNVDVDDADPYNIYAALQDHEVWKAPSNSYNGAIGSPQWNIVGKFDGQDVKVDHQNNRWLYVTSSYGQQRRVDQLKGERVNIEPQPQKGGKYRYTWTTPIAISPHNPNTIYTGGQMLLRSANQGNTWQKISPDLTAANAKKIPSKDPDMPVPYGAITTISESPLTAGLIWVGTDDGQVHFTQNDGKTWEDITPTLEKAGAPKGYWISRVFVSSHQTGTAYVSITGFREDDFRPFVFKTENYGKAWQDISSNLPNQPVNAILDDKDNPNLLYLADDHGIYVSINGGEHWANMNNNIPPVPVEDIAIQNRDGDLVAGTYGRGIYVTDIYPLKQLTLEILNEDVHLFNIEPQPRLNYSQQRAWGIYLLQGDSQLYTPNEPNGLKIYYYLRKKLDQRPTLLIRSKQGKIVKKISCSAQKGINKIIWNTKNASPGTYSVILEAEGSEISKKGVVEKKLVWTLGNKANVK